MTLEELDQLLAQRWMEAQARAQVPPGLVKLTWDLGHYEHFSKPRGYAVTFNWGKPHCHLRMAHKILKAPEHRVDGIIRHEIGHVLDLTRPAAKLNRWAIGRRVRLPGPVGGERRADAIAEAVWRSPIRYDDDLVQSTTHGVAPRPAHLGL
jgi:hypothetical protein